MTSDDRLPGRHRLPEAVVARLLSVAVPEDELRAMCVHTGAPARWVPALVRTGAMTFGRHVFFRAGRYDTASAPGLALIAHEAGHIAQYRALGAPRFLVEHARGAVRSRFRHDRHPLEAPLNRRQSEVRRALEDGRADL
jgi:hypothetical protein